MAKNRASPVACCTLISQTCVTLALLDLDSIAPSTSSPWQADHLVGIGGAADVVANGAGGAGGGTQGQVKGLAVGAHCAGVAHGGGPEAALGAARQSSSGFVFSRPTSPETQCRLCLKATPGSCAPQTDLTTQCKPQRTCTQRTTWRRRCCQCRRRQRCTCQHRT